MDQILPYIRGLIERSLLTSTCLSEPADAGDTVITVDAVNWLWSRHEIVIGGMDDDPEVHTICTSNHETCQLTLTEPLGKSFPSGTAVAKLRTITPPPIQYGDLRVTGELPAIFLTGETADVDPLTIGLNAWEHMVHITILAEEDNASDSYLRMVNIANELKRALHVVRSVCIEGRYFFACEPSIEYGDAKFSSVTLAASRITFMMREEARVFRSGELAEDQSPTYDELLELVETYQEICGPLPEPEPEPEPDPLVNQYAMEFGSSANYIGIHQVYELPVYRTTGYSLSFWVKRTTGLASQVIYSESNIPSAGAPFVIWTTGTTTISVFLFGISKTSTLDVFDDQWHNVIFTDLNGDAHLYVDAIEDTGTDYSYTPSPPASLNRSTIGGVKIAAPSETGSNGLTGILDEFSAFSRVLTADEITNIYNSGSPDNVPTDDLIFWLRMGDAATFNGDDWLLLDQSGNGNHAVSETLTAASRVTDVPS